MKYGVRYIAIASGPIGKKKGTLLVGVIFRDNYIEGMVSSVIKRDGTDSTERIIKMLKKSRFRDQIRILLFNGIALAGLNIIDPNVLENSLNSKVVLLNRRKQNASELIGALKEFSRVTGIDVASRIRIVHNSKSIKPLKANGFFLQSTLEEHHLRKFARSAFESLRIAHIIARGISTGESKGRL